VAQSGHRNSETETRFPAKIYTHIKPIHTFSRQNFFPPKSSFLAKSGYLAHFPPKRPYLLFSAEKFISRQNVHSSHVSARRERFLVGNGSDGKCARYAFLARNFWQEMWTLAEKGLARKV